MNINEFNQMDTLDKRQFLTEDLAEWRQSGVARSIRELKQFNRMVRILASDVGLDYTTVMRHLDRDADLTIEEWKWQAANDSIAGTTLGY